MLLERYLVVEKDEALRTSLMPKLLELRKATQAQIAAALADATQKYPQARLEAEAAQAYEKLGDEPSLRKAAEFWELARTAAATPEERAQFTSSSRRVQMRLLELEQQKKNAEPKVESRAEQKVEKKVEAPESGGTGKILLIGGGVLLVGGAVLAVIGAGKGQTANDGVSQGKFADYTAYQNEKNSADRLNTIGWVAAGVGGGAAIAGLVMGMIRGAPTPTEHAVWLMAPMVAADQGGLVISGVF